MTRKRKKDADSGSEADSTKKIKSEEQSEPQPEPTDVTTPPRNKPEAKPEEGGVEVLGNVHLGQVLEFGGARSPPIMHWALEEMEKIAERLQPTVIEATEEKAIDMIEDMATAFQMFDKEMHGELQRSRMLGIVGSRQKKKTPRSTPQDDINS
eukprot:Clim_evm21s195 gene=Clim_evmTU21s195